MKESVSCFEDIEDICVPTVTTIRPLFSGCNLLNKTHHLVCTNMSNTTGTTCRAGSVIFYTVVYLLVFFFCTMTLSVYFWLITWMSIWYISSIFYMHNPLCKLTASKNDIIIRTRTQYEKLGLALLSKYVKKKYDTLFPLLSMVLYITHDRHHIFFTITLSIRIEERCMRCAEGGKICFQLFLIMHI